MSQFYDQASLVMIPSGYKTGKVYSQKPLSTDGEITFTRASSATRVGPDGLIEKVRTNLVLQSNQFDTIWSLGNSTLTANAGTSPSGANDAWKIESSTIGTETRVRQSVTTTVGVEYSFSCFMKAGNVNWGIVRNYAISLGGRAWFDLQNGVVGAADSGITPSIESVGNGWYRCSITGTATTSGSLDIAPAPANSDFTSNAIGDYVLIYGAQGETGVLTDYIATTTAAVSVGPVANLPRLDYLGATCGPRLLLEPQRTNLKLYSESFSNAAGWNPATNGDASVTFTANYGVSPDGYQNADRLQLALNTGSYVDWLSYNVVTIGTTYTYSIYAKSLSGSVDVEVLGGTPTGNIKKTITTEWTRLTTTFTATSADLYPRFLLQAGTSTSADILVWGAQLEAGAYATSYIGPTLGSAVTRLADACSKTGISSLIGQTEGTLFVEVDLTNAITGTTRRFMAIGDGTSSNRIGLGLNTSNVIEGFVVASGSIQALITSATATNQTYKIAIAYKANDVVLYVNGVQIGTDGSATIPAVANFYLMHEFGSDFPAASGIAQALLFKTRLTNAQLAELTTL